MLRSKIKCDSNPTEVAVSTVVLWREVVGMALNREGAF